MIRTQEDVTKAVLAEVARAKNPRTREILSAAVRHLHDFAREVRLTEEEFHMACAFVARAARFMLPAQVEAGTLCPITMTFAATPLLQQALNPALYPALRPHSPCGMTGHAPKTAR